MSCTELLGWGRHASRARTQVLTGPPVQECKGLLPLAVLAVFRPARAWGRVRHELH